jgi:hypothetical protein
VADKRKVWECKLVLPDDAELPEGADWPMREALRVACKKMTGRFPTDIFSGWDGSLTEI